MNAILWDGNKQLHGFIEFTENELVFRLKDFSDTSLHLEIAYLDIVQICNYKIYGISNEGIEIVSKDGKRNVFVVDTSKALKEKLQTTILNNQIKSN